MKPSEIQKIYWNAINTLQLLRSCYIKGTWEWISKKQFDNREIILDKWLEKELNKFKKENNI
jgi:hypothetical protein